MTWGHYYWPVFLSATGIAFLIPEILALVTNALNTLSWYAWSEMDVKTSTQLPVQGAGWFLSQGAFIVGCLFLLFHIWYHKFT